MAMELFPARNWKRAGRAGARQRMNEKHRIDADWFCFDRMNMILRRSRSGVRATTSPLSDERCGGWFRQNDVRQNDFLVGRDRRARRSACVVLLTGSTHLRRRVRISALRLTTSFLYLFEVNTLLNRLDFNKCISHYTCEYYLYIGVFRYI
jgi:hypothetical protein